MVYLIHFQKKYKRVQHYIGYTNNLKRRMHDHELGTLGAKLLVAVRNAGINFEVVRTWPDADRSFERKLKNRKQASCFCPVCRAEKERKRALSLLYRQEKMQNPLPQRVCRTDVAT